MTLFQKAQNNHKLQKIMFFVPNQIPHNHHVYH
jgi:hypothetical protein